MNPALPEPDRTLCMVRGNIAPGAMCGSMIVGDKSCGNRTSPCQHKVPQFTAAQLEQYASDYHAAMMGKPVAFKCGSYFYPYPSEDAYCDMAEKHVLLYAPKAMP